MTSLPALNDNHMATCFEWNPKTSGEIELLTQTLHCTNANNKVFFDVTIPQNKQCGDFRNVFGIKLNEIACGNSTRLVPCDVDVSAGREPVCRIRCSCPRKGTSCAMYILARNTVRFTIYGVSTTVHCFNRL